MQTTDRTTDGNGLYNRLKTLHENGVFKKLRLDDRSGKSFALELLIQQMVSFSALQMLGLREFSSTAVCQLTQLKELQLEDVKVFDFETMAKNLINLERLVFQGGTVHSSLEKIKIRDFSQCL